MAKDIVPDLLEEIETDFNKRIDGLTFTGKNYNEANDYAIKIGEALSDTFSAKLSSEVLPDGKMYHNIADRVLNKTLANNHELIATATEQVQTSLNKEAGLGIKAIKPKLNQDRIDGLIEKTVKADKYDDVADVLDEPIVNFSQSVVDDAVKTNAEFHHNAGLSPKIVRTVAGDCCEWCGKIAGMHNYEDVKNTGNNVFRRHRYCRCTVEYDPNDGSKKIQNVHTKQISSSEEDKSRRIEQYLKHVQGEEAKSKIHKQKIDFLAGKGNKVLPESLGHWMGDNKYQELMEKVSGEEAKKYIRTAYRKSSIIGDGGTADVRRFEKATGRNLGRNGATHAKKVDDLVRQIEKSLTKDVSSEDRKMLESELKKLKEVQD